MNSPSLTFLKQWNLQDVLLQMTGRGCTALIFTNRTY